VKELFETTPSPLVPPLRSKGELFDAACVAVGKNPNDFNAEVHFVTSDEIRALNKKWRGKDEPTDVLSFPLGDFNPATGKTELGDIVICRECAGEFSEEFLYLHGLLHLMGYTHKEMDAIIKEAMQSVVARNTFGRLSAGSAIQEEIE